jgi:Lrp/AsnC family transcriptional regulator
VGQAGDADTRSLATARMAADVDYLMRVVVAAMGDDDRSYKKLIEAFQLKNVTSRFAMERIKSTTAFRVPETAT